MGVYAGAIAVIGATKASSFSASVAPALANVTADFYTDGVSDEVEIQQALDSIGTGGKLIVRAGTYNLANDVIISGDNITVEGEGFGTVLKAAASSSANCLKITGNNVAVKDMQIDGNKANVTQLGIQYIALNGIYVTGASNILIDGCYIHDHYAGGVLVDESTDIIITNNRIADGVDNGIFLRPSPDDVGVTRATIANNIVSGMSYSGIQAIRSNYITITNNVSYDNGPADSQGDGIGVEGCTYVTITGNVCYSNAIQGISARPTDEGGANLGCSHIVITGNIVYDHTSTNGDAGGIVITASDEVLVTSNHIHSNYYGVNVCESHELTSGDVQLTDNRIVSNTGDGIRVNVTSSPYLYFLNNYVAGNTGHNLYTNKKIYVQGGVYSGATGNGKSGIYLDTGSSDSFIQGAFIYDNKDNGVLSNTSVADIEIKACYFDNIATSNQARALYEVTGPTRLILNRIANQATEPYHFTSGSSVYADEA